MAQKGCHECHQRAGSNKLRITWVHLVSFLDHVTPTSDLIVFIFSFLAAELRNEVCSVFEERAGLARLLRVSYAVNKVRVDEDRVAW